MSEQVASQTRLWPRFHGMRVTQLGLLPSELQIPTGSRWEGILAAARDCLMLRTTMLAWVRMADGCSQADSHGQPDYLVFQSETQGGNWGAFSQAPDSPLKASKRHALDVYRI